MSTTTKTGTVQTAKPTIDPETVTLSGYVVEERYDPKSVPTQDTKDASKTHARIGEPGQFPFTRGVHKTMYRNRLWTMRQFAGFGSADDTNKRFKYNSGAMRKNISWSSALWWVRNGLALAPPGMGCSMGVSTSKKPWPTMNSRIPLTALLRATKRLRALSSVIRST